MDISRITPGENPPKDLHAVIEIPLGGVPTDPRRWILLTVAGVITGGITGAVIGLWAGYRETGGHT